MGAVQTLGVGLSHLPLHVGLDDGVDAASRVCSARALRISLAGVLIAYYANTLGVQVVGGVVGVIRRTGGGVFCANPVFAVRR